MPGRGGAAGTRLGAAFVGIEDEFVGGDRERYGEGAEHVEGGLVGASFVAAQSTTSNRYDPGSSPGSGPGVGPEVPRGRLVMLPE